MIIDKIWEEDFQIRSFQMDPKSKAHLTSICNFLQEGAGSHAEHAGFGFDDMMKRNQVWVLARLKVVVDRYPDWNEQIKLKTWSRGKVGIFYVRDFQIEDGQGAAIVKATSFWAAINIKTRRPEIVEGLEEGLHSVKDKMAIDEKLEKLPTLSGPTLLRKRMIEYTDIDLIYHVNNVKYIEIIFNSFPKEILLNKNIQCIEINYLGEAKFGEEVLVNVDQTIENDFLVNVVKAADNKEVCRAKILWRNS